MADHVTAWGVADHDTPARFLQEWEEEPDLCRVSIRCREQEVRLDLAGASMAAFPQSVALGRTWVQEGRLYLPPNRPGEEKRRVLSGEVRIVPVVSRDEVRVEGAEGAVFTVPWRLLARMAERPPGPAVPAFPDTPRRGPGRPGR